jgi:ribosomal protein S18 acetylase RimI-like enzyme
MQVELRRSSEFSLAELAAIFTAAYDEYLVPFAMDETKLSYMVEALDVDLTRSVVAVDEGRPIGLANLGLRRERAWLGGVGIVPPHRGGGLGELLTRSILDQARGSGASEMVLEVIVENAPAISLYAKLGFQRTRELEVLALAADARGSAARDADLDDAVRRIVATRDALEPWQRDDATVANLGRHPPIPQAMTAVGGAVVFRDEADGISLLQAAGEPAVLDELLAAARSRGRVTALNFPADGRVAGALRKAGAEVVTRQYEMIISL